MPNNQVNGWITNTVLQMFTFLRSAVLSPHPPPNKSSKTWFRGLLKSTETCVNKADDSLWCLVKCYVPLCSEYFNYWEKILWRLQKLGSSCVNHILSCRRLNLLGYDGRNKVSCKYNIQAHAKKKSRRKKPMTWKGTKTMLGRKIGRMQGA